MQFAKSALSLSSSTGAYNTSIWVYQIFGPISETARKLLQTFMYIDKIFTKNAQLRIGIILN